MVLPLFLPHQIPRPSIQFLIHLLYTAPSCFLASYGKDGKPTIAPTIKGNIKVIINKSCHDTIERVNLGDKESVYGNINLFELTPRLVEVKIQGTACFGDIKSFEGCTGLTHLWITDTAIVGDIEVFNRLPNLQHVHASRTQLEGDIQVELHKLDPFRSIQILHKNLEAECIGSEPPHQ